MQKIGNNSHFQVVNGADLKDYGNRIIQIDAEAQYTSGNYFGVYMCEIDDRPSVIKQERLKNK